MAANRYHATFRFVDVKIGNRGFVTYHNVTSLQRLKRSVETNRGQWLFATIYDAATREKLAVVTPTTIHTYEPLKLEKK